MSHNFNKTIKNTFITPNQEWVLKNAPIGYDDVSESVQRGGESEGIVLAISQNQQFIGEDKDFIVNYFLQNGAGGELALRREEDHAGTLQHLYTDYADLNTLKWDKTTATCDFRDNSFDTIFDENKKEKFELDRATDINGNSIPDLQKAIYRHYKRKLLLRSRLENTETKTFNGVLDHALFPIPVEVDYQSDPAVVTSIDSDIRFFSDLVGNGTMSVTNMFYFNSERAREFRITATLDINISNVNTFVFGIARYSNDSSLEYNGGYNLNTNAVNGQQTLTGSATVNVEKGDSLMLYVSNDAPPGFNLSYSSCKVEIEEDELFQPINLDDLKIDCITLKQGFESWFKILGEDVTFKSDFLDNNWPHLVLFNGKTLRHVKELDPDTEEEVKTSIGTTSFEKLYEFIFTLEPCTYGIEIERGQIVFRLEKMEYFYENKDAIHLGQLESIEREVNKDFTYKKVEIGYTESGEIEEFYGLLATHAVSNWTLPCKTAEKAYKATTDFRTDPIEIEACFRIQASEFPDRDTKYDDDIFIVDAFTTNGLGYIARIHPTDFQSISGVYHPVSMYNVRLSPLNCLLRHGFNFKQEYTKPVYANSSVVFTSSNGNKSLKTQLLGGVAYQENDNVPLNAFGNPLFNNILVKGEANYDFDTRMEVRGGTPKKNYYKVVTFVNENGVNERGFVHDLQADDGKIKAELKPVING